jgi:hypothetical protein
LFSISPYTPDRLSEWNAFVAQSKNGTFLFDRSYMDYHADRFTDHSLMFFIDGSLMAVLPANRRGDTLFSHQGLSYGGLVMSAEATTAKVCTLFDELNALLLEQGIAKVVYKPVPWIFHSLPAEEDLYAIFLRCNAQLTGRDVSSTIIPNRPVKWKRDRHYAANKARTNGIIVRQTDDFTSFWEILSDNLMAKFEAKPVHSLQEILLLHQRFPQNIQLWAAYSPDGQMLAATVLYHFRHVVHSQYISASEEGKRLHAVDGLFDHLLHKAFANVPFFNLGTSNMPHSSDLHDSLIYQKEGFGGRAVCYDTYEWRIEN